MRRLTEQAHELCRAVVAEGECVIDATSGNGLDTVFLARLVGETGVVYAIDRQNIAIDNTRRRLQQDGLNNVILVEADHARLKQAVPPERHGLIPAVMFNLGYLPGGDKSLITQPSTTLPAIEQALELLRPGGIVTVLCYTGHEGGAEETAAVLTHLQALPANEFEVQQFGDVAVDSAPRLVAVWKNSSLRQALT